MVKIQQIMKRLINTNVKRSVLLFAVLVMTSACKNSDKETEQPTPSVEAEILTLQPTDAVIDQTFPASLQGKDDVQLRPQISGYIDKIFVDEGAFVRAGQPLFRINASVYREQKNTALASLAMAKSQLASAKLELDKYKVLTDNKVVADFSVQKGKNQLLKCQSGGNPTTDIGGFC